MSALSYFNEPAPLAWDVAAAIFGSTGEGGLYDPSALDTIFQDANGTTPAVPGSPVGLVLDARKEMGPELVGALDFTVGWSLSPGVTVTSPNSVQKNSTQPGGIYRSYLEIGKVYKVTVSYGATGDVQVRNGISGSDLIIFPAAASRQNETAVFVASRDQLYFRIVTNEDTMENVSLSIREVLNPPLSQPTTAARPILARMPKTGRRNRILPSESLATVWARVGATLSGEHTILETATSGVHRTSQAVTWPENGIISGWIDVEGIGREFVLIRVETGGLFANRLEFTINSLTGAVVKQSALGTFSGPTVSFVGKQPDGKNRYSFQVNTGDKAGNGTLVFVVMSLFDATTTSFIGDPSKGFSTSRIQLAPGPLSPYQHVRSAYDVTEEGVPDTYSLVYDLADDNLTTTLPQAINGDILIAGTKGSIIEPVSYAAGSAFTIGPDTYTGGTPGILRAIGDIVGLVLIDRTLTQTERENLIRHYKGKGAKGLLVQGPELAVNGLGDFTGLSAAIVSDTEFTTELSGAGVYIGLPSGIYKVELSRVLPSGVTSLSIRDYAGGAGTVVQELPSTAGESSAVAVVPISLGNMYIRVAQTPPKTIEITSISVRELRPQEDW